MSKSRSNYKFPFFRGFVGFSLVAWLLQAVTYSHLSAAGYFYQYWGTTAVLAILSFMVVYEVFVYVLRPYSALVDLGKLLFKWAVGFLALASLLTALATTGNHMEKICATVKVLDRSCDLMLCGLLLLLALLQSRLGLSWRNPGISIMLGLGVNAAVTLSSSFLQDHFPAATGIAWVGPFCWVAVSAHWLASFALPEAARRTIQDSPTRLILRRWNDVLTTSPLVTRRSEVIPMPVVESFLPGVERTVERIMAQRMAR
jgi:hypothetical protein